MQPVACFRNYVYFCIALTNTQFWVQRYKKKRFSVQFRRFFLHRPFPLIRNEDVVVLLPHALFLAQYIAARRIENHYTQWRVTQKAPSHFL